MKLEHIVIALLAALVVVPLSPAWGGAKYRVLHSFGSGSDGTQPYGPLLLDGKGNLYGVTANGGGSGCGGAGCGTVFELAPLANGKWKELIIHRFTNGSDEAIPEGNLVSDAEGNLYGWVKGGYVGQTAVFELTPGTEGWNLSLIWTHGSSPGLLLDQADSLYGFMGYHAGPIAELSPGSNGWTYTDLYDFCRHGCYDGSLPESPLSWDAQGNLYGTTAFGGNEPPLCPWSGGCGVAFQMIPNQDGTWTYHVLHRFASFQTDGLRPYAGLTVDAAGNAYGATSAGGAYNCGTIFKLGPQESGKWEYSVVHTFHGPEGCAPLYTLAFDGAGSLYGMAQGGDPNCGPCGVIFKLTPQSTGKWKYSVVHTFHGAEGAGPYGVILDSKGNIFGTTASGGAYNLGVAFEITPVCRSWPCATGGEPPLPRSSAAKPYRIP